MPFAFIMVKSHLNNDEATVNEIFRRVNNKDLGISGRMEIRLPEDIAKEFLAGYRENAEQSRLLLRSITSAPVHIALVYDIIEPWVTLGYLAGPDDPKVAKVEEPRSLRALYGVNSVHNVCFVSTSQDQAMRWAKLFYSEKFIERHNQWGVY